MTKSSILLKEGRTSELWEKHCGYLDLSLDEFMEIQKRLLMEQISLLSTSEIGQKFLGKVPPKSVDEFRERVPFTTYPDYEEFLAVKNEDALPVKPYVWARTSGRTSSKGPKWVPYTKELYDRLGDAVVGSMLMCSCRFPGDVQLMRNDKLLLSTAPPPYTSGYISRSASAQLDLRFLPPIEIGEKMGYGERLALGFKMAMGEGIDYFMGLASVLTRMGEQFQQQSSNTKPSKDMLNPIVLFRLIKALIVSKMNNREILPRDIWKLKGIMTGGTDTNIYRHKIEEYWGLKPLEGYSSTESGNMAMQAWNFKGMIFFPDSAFLEFIKFEDHLRSQEDPTFIPRTYLYDEIEEGIYELVFTNFNGGVFVRYRIGDMFEFISTYDEELDSHLPQANFYSRQHDLIDLGTILRFSEKDIWKSLESSGVPYTDWVARKEVDEGHVKLHIYIEPKSEVDFPMDDVIHKIDRYFLENLSEYRDMKEMFQYEPLIISLLPVGAFMAYMKAQQEAGADLAHIKPPHIQPNETVMGSLLGDELE